MPQDRVMYVDDEADIREVAVMSLELDADLDVLPCACGVEALLTAPQWQPDLILLDVMMPEMDGPGTLEGLRRNPATAKTPVVFVTARTQSSEIERFLALGAAGVIAKPFDPMTLAAQARRHLRPAAS